MNIRTLSFAGVLLSICGMSPSSPRIGVPNPHDGAPPRAVATPFEATRCDLTIPIRIALVPLNQPRVGQPALFRVEADSSIDPDLVVNSWVEYELPPRIQRSARAAGTRELLGRSRSGRAQLDVIVPDVQRYEIRARYVVQLTNGRTIGQTAVRHINIGNIPPEGMVGRLVDSDGNGIRVFRGATARN